MASLRCVSLLRQPIKLSTRSLSTSRIVRNQAASVNMGTVQAPRKPVGGIRGGIAGFLLGFSVAATFAAYNLLDEYKQASMALLASVEELQASTQALSAHVRRIEAVEQDLKALSESTASNEDIGRIRAELKRLYDGLHIEFLDLRSHVWGIQQDLHSLSKKDSTSVRI